MPDYFTLVELRELPDMGDATKYPDARCEAAATAVVGVIEREVGTAFIPRTVTAELHDGGCTGLVLHHADAIAVSSLTVGGVTADPSTYVLMSGVVQLTSGAFGSGIGNVSVTYTYAYSTTPPGDVKEAALKGTRAHLIATRSNSTMDDRRTTLNTEAGTINFTVAGKDQPTGYPEVDAMILGWKERLDVDGFA